MITKVGTVTITEKETIISGFEFSYPYIDGLLPLNSGMVEVAEYIKKRAEATKSEVFVKGVV